MVYFHAFRSCKYVPKPNSGRSLFCTNHTLARANEGFRKLIKGAALLVPHWDLDGLARVVLQNPFASIIILFNTHNGWPIQSKFSLSFLKSKYIISIKMQILSKAFLSSFFYFSTEIWNIRCHLNDLYEFPRIHAAAIHRSPTVYTKISQSY